MDDLKVFARSFRLMMALLIGAALLIAACVSENAGEWERVPLIPAIGAIALAVGFCVVLLTKGDPKRIAAGSGIAAGLALPTCFALPMVILFLSASDDRDDVAANRALMLLFVVAVYIVVQAFRQAQLGGQFAVGFAIAFLYALATAGAISVMPAHYQHRAAKEPLGSYEYLAPEALGTLRSVTGCLIKDQALHPDAGFPASLPTAAETHCDGYTVSSDVLKHYTLSYSPRNDANGTATDFQLSLVPNVTGLPNADPLMSDKRGLIFTWKGWHDKKQSPRLVLQWSDLEASSLLPISADFERYLVTYGAPKSFTEVLAKYPERVNPESIDEGREVEQTPFVLSFKISEAPGPKIAISAFCKEMHYAGGCFRSYQLDFSGSIHWTAQPRAATLDDPVLGLAPSGTPCEGPPHCNDAVDWPMPDRKSKTDVPPDWPSSPG